MGYMVEGFVLEYNKGEGFFCKRAREWKGYLKNRGKGRDLWAILPLLLLPPIRNKGGGGWGAGGPVAGVLGHGGG